MNRMHILVVDDEVDTHLIYKMKFKKTVQSELITLSFFLGAKDCLKFIKSNPNPKVDLILSDINMPEMDGLQMLSEVKSYDSKLPVYMVSAYEHDTYKTAAADAGASRYFAKPLVFKDLIDAIEQDFSIKFT